MHQFGGEPAQREGLTAAGHRADSEAASLILEDLLLCRAQRLFSGHEIVGGCRAFGPTADGLEYCPRG